MVWVEKAKYVEEYKIWIKFNNGSEGIIDFKPILEKDQHPIITDLLNLHKFKDFSADVGTLCWSNGADFAPEFLYDILKKNRACSLMQAVFAPLIS
jgi:hypothetical protein